MTATGNSELERTGSDVSRVCVCCCTLHGTPPAWLWLCRTPGSPGPPCWWRPSHWNTHRALWSHDHANTPVCYTCVCLCVLHGGWGQVGVFMFELPVQSESSLLSVLVQCRGQSVHLAEGGAGWHLVAVETRRCCQANRSGKPRPSTNLIKQVWTSMTFCHWF